MYRYTYYRLVEKVDREIGKIVDAIDKGNLWKGRNREQLFDMQNDQGEMRNLVVENAHSKELHRHRDILAQWMEDCKIRSTRPKLHDVPGRGFSTEMKAIYTDLKAK